MKVFEVPVIDIAKFDIEDVITTSGDTIPGETTPGGREDEFPLV